MSPADQLTVARMAAAPVIVVLFVADFAGHEYWATAPRGSSSSRVSGSPQWSAA